MDTSSSPWTTDEIPSKSPPIPTWSMPATVRMCSTWSATSARVARGVSSSGPSQVRTASLTKPGTKVTMTTPPFSGRRRSTSSGTLRGWSVTARADEWEKITGASVTSRTSCIVSGDVWDRSTSMPRRFISRITSRPNRVSPP